jgi:hypothetical protein
MRLTSFESMSLKLKITRSTFAPHKTLGIFRKLEINWSMHAN